MGVKSQLQARIGSPRVSALSRRVDELEKSLLEVRAQNLRLAEIADVIQELLIPLSSRDQERVDEAIERFSKGL